MHSYKLFSTWPHLDDHHEDRGQITKVGTCVPLYLIMSMRVMYVVFVVCTHRVGKNGARQQQQKTVREKGRLNKTSKFYHNALITIYNYNKQNLKNKII